MQTTSLVWLTDCWGCEIVILIVKAITPSILVRFSKFWCLNISTFQDLSFSFAEQPRGTCPRGQKRVLKLVHEKKMKKFEKNELLGLIQLISFYRSTGKCIDCLSLKFGVCQTLPKKVMSVCCVEAQQPLVASNDL